MIEEPSKELLELAKETVHKTSIQEVLIVERETIPDQRGFFRETYRKKELEAVLGRQLEFVQQNHSRNNVLGTLKGIHIAPWDKFIYVVRGSVQAVVVDLRRGSSTFGQYESIEIGENRRAKIFVPRGCGNAYLVLSDQADYLYDTTDYWVPNMEQGIAWDDPDLAIEWMFQGNPILSEKDKNNPTARELFP